MSRYPEKGELRNVKLHGEKQSCVTNQDGTITVHIPISFKKHGGRKYIITPEAMPEQYTAPVEKDSILKAIGQAFTWKSMIEEGKVASVTELAKKLKVNESYAGRIVRLTLLAPDILESLLNGRQPKYLTLRDLSKPFPLDWNEQREQLGFLAN